MREIYCASVTLILCGRRHQDHAVAAYKQHLNGPFLLAINFLVRFFINLHYVYDLLHITKHHVQVLVESLKL